MIVPKIVLGCPRCKINEEPKMTPAKDDSGRDCVASECRRCFTKWVTFDVVPAPGKHTYVASIGHSANEVLFALGRLAEWLKSNDTFGSITFTRCKGTGPETPNEGK